VAVVQYIECKADADAQHYCHVARRIRTYVKIIEGGMTDGWATVGSQVQGHPRTRSTAAVDLKKQLSAAVVAVATAIDEPRRV